MTSKLKFALFGNVYQGQKIRFYRAFATAAETQRSRSFDRQGILYLPYPNTPHRLSACRTDRTQRLRCGHRHQHGGDGTFLEAASRVRNKNIPILGINVGRLGFLADVSPDEIEDAISDIYEGIYKIDERSVIQVEYVGPSLKGYPYALNEVAVLKRDNSSMISIRVEVNGEFLATYQADGLIVNTPTGSTGYALSVGGPIIVPQSGTFCITPVASHSLNARPITLRDQAELSLSIESRNHNFLVAIDGRSEACTEATKLILRRAPYNIKVLQRKQHSFFTTLREKLMWGTDPRE